MAIPYVPNSTNIQTIVENNSPQGQNQESLCGGREWTVLTCAGDAINYIVSKIFIMLAQTFSAIFDVLAETTTAPIPHARIPGRTFTPPAPLDVASLERYGHGIINGGSTCYMNAGLQWIRKLQDGLLPTARRPAPARSAGGNILLQVMRNLFRTL